MKLSSTHEGLISALPRLRLLSTFLGAILVLCLVLHFLVKDRIDAFAILYYASPLPILAVFAVVLGIICWCGKQIRKAKVYFVLAVGCLMAWSYESFSLHARPFAFTESNVRLFFWNAARHRRPNDIANYIQGFDADVIGIVEAGMKRKMLKNWKTLFSDYHVEALAGDMALMAKGKILSKASGSLDKRGHYNLLQVDLNRCRIHVLLVDIDGDPFKARSPAFAPLTSLIRVYSQTNFIVMGDFNTPIGSVLFDSFRQNLANAFEHGGAGPAETWPVPLPVLAIDHIWVSKRINVVDCDLDWPPFSDHRAIVANVEPAFIKSNSLDAEAIGSATGD